MPKKCATSCTTVCRMSSNRSGESSSPGGHCPATDVQWVFLARSDELRGGLLEHSGVEIDVPFHRGRAHQRHVVERRQQHTSVEREEVHELGQLVAVCRR